LDSIAFTLNHIYLQDHSARRLYEQMEDVSMLMAAEDSDV